MAQPAPVGAGAGAVGAGEAQPKATWDEWLAAEEKRNTAFKARTEKLYNEAPSVKDYELVIPLTPKTVMDAEKIVNFFRAYGDYNYDRVWSDKDRENYYEALDLKKTLLREFLEGLRRHEFSPVAAEAIAEVLLRLKVA